MEVEVKNLLKNTGSVTQTLKDMPLGEENAMDVELVDAASIRALITYIHGQKTGYKFKTAKTDLGIKVWRIQ